MPNNLDISTLETWLWDAACKIKARSVNGGIITAMLCDKDNHNKVMEDFSCNNSKVEVRTWEKEKPEPCKFEIQWEDVINKDCKR